MATSYNGWALRPARSLRKVPGTGISLEVVDGKAGDILIYVAEQFHKRVEPLVPGTCFGYAYRVNVNNPSVWSNHASATAIDLNSLKHPNGRSGTFTRAQYAEIDKILSEVGGVVRHLSDDEMHWEINASKAKVNAVTIAGSAPVDPGSRTLRKGDSGKDVVFLQVALNKHLTDTGHPLIVADGDFGPLTDTATRAFQRFHGLAEDGVVGPETWARVLSGNNPSGGSGGSGSVGSSSTSSKALSRGSEGKEVKDLQAFLNRYAPSYSSLAVDGLYGPATESVVRQLQARLGVPVTGVFDSTTARKVGYHVVG